MKIFFFVLAAAAALAQDVPTGIVKAGGISIVRTDSKTSLPNLGTIASTVEVFGGQFQATDYTNYTPPPPPDPSQLQTVGPCTVAVGPAQPSTNTSRPVVTPLDAGPVLNLNGPNGSKQFPVNKGSYGGTLGGGIPLPIPSAPPVDPLFIVPGTYTVDNGSGGPDIGPFMVTLTIPDPLFQWTNPDDNLTIDRSVGVNVTWVGGDPNAKVTVSGTSTVIDPTTLKAASAGIFICSVDNTGEFFVSPDVLSLLPASVSPPNIPVPLNTLTVSSGIQIKFDATGDDTNLFTFSSGYSRAVTYQ